MNENKYIILSDDTSETKKQFDMPKEDEEKIDAIIKKALKQNKAT